MTQHELDMAKLAQEMEEENFHQESQDIQQAMEQQQLEDHLADSDNFLEFIEQSTEIKEQLSFVKELCTMYGHNYEDTLEYFKD